MNFRVSRDTYRLGYWYASTQVNLFQRLTEGPAVYLSFEMLGTARKQDWFQPAICNCSSWWSMWQFRDLGQPKEVSRTEFQGSGKSRRLLSGQVYFVCHSASVEVRTHDRYRRRFIETRRGLIWRSSAALGLEGNFAVLRENNVKYHADILVKENWRCGNGEWIESMLLDGSMERNAIWAGNRRDNNVVSCSLSIIDDHDVVRRCWSHRQGATI